MKKKKKKKKNPVEVERVDVGLALNYPSAESELLKPSNFPLTGRLRQ